MAKIQHASTRASVAAITAIKSLSYRTPLSRVVFPTYDFMFKPAQLCFMIQCLTATTDLPGPIIEIGCAAGSTTVFVNRHLDELQDRRRYVCIDTFDGFTDEDIAVETERGKDEHTLVAPFKTYRKAWFDRTMQNNGINRVTSIQADVNTFDFSPYEAISFCLVDVDLARPVAKALREVFPRMAPGGIIVVDDCRADNIFDGALEAYTDFCAEIGVEPSVEHGKLGVIRIPTS